MSAPTVPAALRARSFRADRIAWVVFLALIAGSIAATEAWLHRRVRTPDAAPVAVTHDFRLPVLAYDRVVTGERLDAERVAEHFEALRADGFHPVSLRQVREAYRGGAPLPARPILITFDGGHLSTYDAVDPLLRRLRWPAVMFVDPRLQEERHATYVYWDRLQRMVDSGLWDVGTVGPWPVAARVVERHLGGYEVLARARRPGDADGAGAAPPLAFENASFGVNDPGNDPARLFRLRVPPGWSGRELVERLRASLAAPEAAASGEPAPVAPMAWACSIGQLEPTGDGLVLTGAPRAEAWLAGAEWARDFVLEAEVRPAGGAFWVSHQAVGSKQQWRWGGTERTLYLQRVQPGSPIEVVWRADVASGRGGWHKFRLVKRGRGVWVEWDGRRLEPLPHVVSAPWRGYVGFSTGSAKEAGRLLLRNVRFAAFPYEVRTVSGSPSEAEIQALLGDAPRLAAISPPGLVEEGATLTRRQQDDGLLAMVAAYGAWDIVPTIELTGDESAISPRRAAELADLAVREGWAGVRVSTRDLPAAARAAWRDAAPSWQRLFGRRELRLVLDAADATVARSAR